MICTEIQLGQGDETIAKVVHGKRLRAAPYRRGESVVMRANDPRGHWRRLWRVMATDEELNNVIHKIPYDQAPLYAQSLRSKMNALDAQRASLLASKHEGIVFLSHEVEAVCLEHFELEANTISFIF